jgi:hypothetical protein
VQVKVSPDEKAARRFHSAITELRKISGKDFETVMKAELGAALSGAVRLTKTASKGSIIKSNQSRPGAQYNLNYSGPESHTGKTYTASEVARAKRRAADRRGKSTNGKLVYYFNKSKRPKNYPSTVWGKISGLREKSLQNKMKARGLAASMFVKIGDALGIPVKAPKYVAKAAHHKKGEMRELIEVVSKGSGASYEVGFVNNLGYLNRWAQAGTAFRKALNARANYFSRAVKLAASGKIKKTLDRYPGLASTS